MKTELKFENYCEGCECMNPIADAEVKNGSNTTTITIACRSSNYCKRLYNQLRKETTVPIKLYKEGETNE